MRVLLHCVYYPPEVGGLESHVEGLARGLVSEGHEVRVVTSRSRPESARREERDGVRVGRTWMPWRNPLGWTLHALGSVPLTRRWARWADVVHAQAFASVPPARAASRLAGRPLIVTLHTSHFLQRAARPIWRPVLRRIVLAGDHVLAASGEIAEVAMALSPGNLTVEALTNGVDTDRFRPGPSANPPRPGVRRVLVPRRLYPKNGVEFLVRAVPAVRRRFPELEVLVVGDGPERARLEALARELGVDTGIRFLGARPHDEMPDWLRSAEIAVIPSLMEATSVAGLEAMASGLPVVASRVGGLPEIVEEGVGALVPPGDPEALAGAMIALLDDPELRARGLRAREAVVARWSNRRLVRRHLEIYRELLEGRAVPSVRNRNVDASTRGGG